MWGNVSREEGAQREEDLNDEVLPKMDGSRTQRFEKTYESAWRIIGSLAKKDMATPDSQLRLQVAIHANEVPSKGLELEAFTRLRGMFSR